MWAHFSLPKNGSPLRIHFVLSRSLCYLDGQRVEFIAEKLNVHRATIYTELKRGYTGEMDRNGRPGYSATTGQQKIYENRVRRFANREAVAESAT